MVDMSLMTVVALIFEWILQCINAGLINVLFIVGHNETTDEPIYTFKFDGEKMIAFIKASLLQDGEGLPLEVLKSFPEEIGGGEEGVKNATANPNREIFFVVVPLAVAIVMLVAMLGLFIINFCICTKEFCCHRRLRRRRPAQGREKNKPEEPRHDDDEHVDERSSDGANETADRKQNRTFDNGYDGYAFYGDDYEEIEPRDSGFQYYEDPYGKDGYPKGFWGGLRGLYVAYKSTIFGSIMKENQEKVMEKVEEKLEALADKSEFVRKHQNFCCCCCHLITLVLVLAYVTALIVCIVLYILAAQEVANVMGPLTNDTEMISTDVIAWLNGLSANYNLISTVKFVLNEIMTLLTTRVNESIFTMKETMNGLGTLLEPVIERGATTMFTTLQNVTQIDQIFNQTDQIYADVQDFKMTLENGENIYTNTIKIILIMDHNLNATLKLQSSCPIVQNNLQAIDLGFHSINLKPIAGADKIQPLVDNIGQVKHNLKEIKQQIEAMPGQLASNLTEQLNFTEYITQIQEQLDTTLEQIVSKIGNFSEQLPQFFASIQPFIKPALFVPAVLMAVIGLAFFACIVLFIAECCYRKLVSCNGEGPAVLVDGMRSRRSHMCGGCRFLTSSILLIVLVILGLLAAVILAISSVVAVEVCPYMADDRGINQSDYVLNSVIASNWPPIQNELLDLPAAKNVIHALKDTCNPANGSDPKLLRSVGVTKLTNLTKLAESGDLNNKLDSIITKMSEEIPKQIPEDVINKIKEVEKSVDGLRTAFDYYNAKAAMEELQKLIGKDTTELKAIVQKLLIESVPACQEAGGKLGIVINILEKNEQDFVNLSLAYKAIDSHSNLPDLLKNYTTLAIQVLQEFKDSLKLQSVLTVHIRPLLNELLLLILNNGTDIANELVDKILPCGGIHYITGALFSSGCSIHGLVPRLFGWALTMTLATLFTFLSFVGLFNLWCIQSHQIKRFYG